MLNGQPPSVSEKPCLKNSKVDDTCKRTAEVVLQSPNHNPRACALAHIWTHPHTQEYKQGPVFVFLDGGSAVSGYLWGNPSPTNTA